MGMGGARCWCDASHPQQVLGWRRVQGSHLLSPSPGSTPPPRSLASWLTSRGLGHTQDETTACIPHDIYVIGTQENSLGDREWVEFLRASLKTLMAIDYRVVMTNFWGCFAFLQCGRWADCPVPQVALQCLWSIKMVVLVKPEHERRISHVHTSSVKTGIANTLGKEEMGILSWGGCPRAPPRP